MTPIMNINDTAFTLFLIIGLLGWTIIKKQRLTEIKFFRSQPFGKWFILLMVICLISSTRSAFLVPFQIHPSATQLLLDDWRNDVSVFDPSESSNSNAPVLNLVGPWLMEIWFRFDLNDYNSLLLWNALEEIGRFGMVGILIIILPFERRKNLSYLVLHLFVGTLFSLSHEYTEQFSGLLTSVLPPYLFAFILSLVLVEIGLRFGIFSAYISHLLINMLDFNFTVYAPGKLMYINFLLALTASFLALWMLFRQVVPAPKSLEDGRE